MPHAPRRVNAGAQRPLFWRGTAHFRRQIVWEPSSAYSFYVGKAQWDKLPREYQAAFEAAAYAVNADMMAEYDAKNPTALKRLIANGVKLHSFPVDFMKAARDAAFSMYDDEAAKNPAFKKIYLSWMKFRDDQLQWHRVAEQTMAAFSFANKATIKTVA